MSKDLLKFCLEIITHSCLSLLFIKSSEAPVWMKHEIKFWCLWQLCHLELWHYPALALYTHPVALQRDNSHGCALRSTISQIPEYIDSPEFHHSSKYSQPSVLQVQYVRIQPSVDLER